jgi:hypothetical protein
LDWIAGHHRSDGQGFSRSTFLFALAPHRSLLDPDRSQETDTVAGMDVQVPDEVRTELIQILSNLVLGDNEIRAKWVYRPSAE